MGGQFVIKSLAQFYCLGSCVFCFFAFTCFLSCMDVEYSVPMKCFVAQIVGNPVQ